MPRVTRRGPLLVLSALCWLPVPAAHADSSMPLIHTADGSQHRGRIVSWHLPDELVLVSETGGTERVASRNVDRILFDQRPPGKSAGQWRIRTRDGSRLVADITDGRPDRMTIRHAVLGSFDIPLAKLASIVSAEAGNVPIQPAEEQDTIVLANGDVARGTVADVSAESITLFVGDLERTYPWGVVKAWIAPKETSRPPEGLAVLLELTDGTRLMTTGLSWRDDKVQIALFDNPPVRLQERNLVYVEVVGGRRVWLGVLPPARYTSIPYFSTQWPYRVDRNVIGGPLALGGRIYRRGIGLHAACRATWQLDKRFDRFTATVGIDDSAGPHADADITVALDGKPLVIHKHLQAGQAPKRINIPVTGVEALTIEVGFGLRGDIQDRVNLVKAALIRP